MGTLIIWIIVISIVIKVLADFSTTSKCKREGRENFKRASDAAAKTMAEIEKKRSQPYTLSDEEYKKLQKEVIHNMNRKMKK